MQHLHRRAKRRLAPASRAPASRARAVPSRKAIRKPAAMRPELAGRLPANFTVFLARHASADRSLWGPPYHLPPGPALSRRGLSEAAALGAFLQSEGVAWLHVSPLERTQRTAAIASDLCGARLETSPDAAEWQPHEDDPALLLRVERAFAAAARCANEAGQPAALVTHGRPVFLLLKSLGLPAAALDACRIYDDRNPVSPGGAWRVAREGQRLRIDLAFAPPSYRLPPFEARRCALLVELAGVPA
jgi:hypothetical protein